jgi:hypothetical protein
MPNKLKILELKVYVFCHDAPKFEIDTNSYVNGGTLEVLEHKYIFKKFIPKYGMQSCI